MKKSFSILAAGCFLFMGSQVALAADESKLLDVVNQLESKVLTMQDRINELEGKDVVRDERLQAVEEKSELAQQFAESLNGGFLKAGDDKSVKWFGDLRFRYEYEKQGVGKGALVTTKRSRDRYRVRARFGAKVKISENWLGEFRVATGGGSNLNSPHEDLGLVDGKLNGLSAAGKAGNPALKVDKVNIGYNFADYHTTLLVGKFGLPATKFTDLIMDGDINPEGIAFAYNNKDAGIKFMGSYVFVDGQSWETAGLNDTDMIYFNGAYNFEVADSLKATLYAGYANVIYKKANPYIIAASSGFQVGAQLKGSGWRVAGEYYDTNATVADTAYTAQVRYNVTKSLGLRAYYYYVEAFSLPADGLFTQDNFPGPVTNWKGYRLQVDYKFNKNVKLDVRYYLMDAIKDDTAGVLYGALSNLYTSQANRNIGRFQVNLNLKF